MKFNNKLFIIATIVVMTGASLAVNAGVFKCMDSNSKIIYQAGPCIKAEGDRIKIKQSSPEEKEVERIKIEKEYRMRQAEVDAKQREAAQQIDPQLAEGIAQAQATLLSSDIGGKHAAAAFLNYANERLRNQQQSRELGQKLDRQQRDNKQQIEDLDYTVRNAEGYQHGWKVYEKPQPGSTYGGVETNPYGARVGNRSGQVVARTLRTRGE